jgi:hypothetical protein
MQKSQPGVTALAAEIAVLGAAKYIKVQPHLEFFNSFVLGRK